VPEVPLKGKNETLVKILGVVSTGRPLQVKYWAVATPAVYGSMGNGTDFAVTARMVTKFVVIPSERTTDTRVAEIPRY